MPISGTREVMTTNNSYDSYANTTAPAARYLNELEEGARQIRTLKN